MTPKEKISSFLSAGCSLLRNEDYFCSLEVLYGCLGISKLQSLIKNIIVFFSCKFFQFLDIKNLDPDPDPH
jgi:hypothetical protein